MAASKSCKRRSKQLFPGLEQLPLHERRIEELELEETLRSIERNEEEEALTKFLLDRWDSLIIK